MSNSRPTASQNGVATLDKDTLFLLKVRVMQDTSAYRSNRKFASIEDLKSHIDTISITHSFFLHLQKKIGFNEENNRRRTIVNIKTVWEVVSGLLKEYSCRQCEACNLDYLAEIFGFDSKRSMLNAICSNNYQYNQTGKVGKVTQDKIARAMRYDNWLAMNNESDCQYAISVSVLKRAFGLVNCASAIKEGSLNILTQYMCSMNWREYNTTVGRKQAFDSVIKQVVKPQMNTVIGMYGQSAKAKTPTLPNLMEGDAISITHADGTVEKYELVNGELRRVVKNSDMCA